MGYDEVDKIPLSSSVGLMSDDVMIKYQLNGTGRIRYSISTGYQACAVDRAKNTANASMVLEHGGWGKAIW